ISKQDTNERIDLAETLDDSLRFTHNWMSVEVKRVEEPETWQPSDSQVLRVGRQTGSVESAGVKPFDGDWKDFNWKRAMDYWKQAFSNYGIIERCDERTSETRRYLELWRAMTEVDGYVCCMKSKRTTLQQVINDLGTFDVSSKDSKSCMFIASPGSG